MIFINRFLFISPSYPKIKYSMTSKSLTFKSVKKSIFKREKIVINFSYAAINLKITGSQESIIQLELDDEEDEISPDRRRRFSVSPMPQMQRSSESQVSKIIFVLF